MLFGDFFSGLALPFRAFKLVLTTPRLFMLSLLCFALSLATLIALLVFLWPAAGWVTTGWVAEGSWWRTALGGGLHVLVYLALVAIGLLTVPSLLLAPLQDPLSEATETKLGNFTPPPFSVARTISGAGTSLLHTVARIGLMLIGIVVLLPLNFIPVAGSVLYGVLSAAWSMWWVSAEYLSGPMARHLFPFSAVLKAMRARPLYAMGMGAALYVVLWVPVLNCFLVPLATVAGTMMYRALPEGAQPARAGT